MNSLVLTKPEVDELQSFFLRSASRCYVKVEASKAKLPHGGRRYELTESIGEKVFRYIDEYFVNGEYSAGLTQIFCRGGINEAWSSERLVWVMQYRGQCHDDDPRILDFHKASLRHNYERSFWFAGRGPSEFTDGRWRGLAYYNQPELMAFEEFYGFEEIKNLKEREAAGFPTVFWHRYQGGLLVPVQD